jgi:hypothetical protein
MQKQHAQDADDGAPASDAPGTPRASGEVAKLSLEEPTATVEGPPSESSTRSEPPSEREPSDTLLSAGKPAARLELLLEDGLSQIEARLRELDARLAVLEQHKPSSVAEPRHKPWLWIVFLIALVVAFQMLQRVR